MAERTREPVPKSPSLGSPIALAIAVCLLMAAAFSCRRFEGKASTYKRYMHCADRVTNDFSVQVMKPGRFGCEALPEDVKTPSQAKRFYLQKAWRADPSSPDPPWNMALTYWREGDFRNSLRYFDAARERKRGDITPVVGMVTMYRLLGERETALSWVRWLRARRGPGAERISAYLEGRLLYEAGNREEAKPLLEKALALGEREGFALGGSAFSMEDAEFFLAQIALDKGDTQKADALFRAYMRRNDDPEFMAYMNLLVSEGATDQRKMYAEIEEKWVHGRQ